MIRGIHFGQNAMPSIYVTKKYNLVTAIGNINI